MLGMLEIAWAAMTLETWIFRAAARGDLWDEALILMLMAGASLAFSQALVLFVNQVPPARFLLAILVNAALFALGVAFWGVSTVFAVAAVGLPTPPRGTVFSLVGLAQAPYLLSVFSVVPHVGLLWHKLLEAWALVCLVAALSLGFGVSFELAGFVGLLGWGFSRVLLALTGPVIGWVPGRLRQLVVGRELADPRTLAAEVRAKAAAARVDLPA
jgi:hypothetical protein